MRKELKITIADFVENCLRKEVRNNMRFWELKEDGTIYTYQGDKYIKKQGGLWNVHIGDWSTRTMCDIMEVEFEEVPRFSQLELHIMDSIDPEYVYISRDKSGELHLYTSPPSYDRVRLPFSELFKNIKSEDENATKIIRKEAK